MNIQTLDGEPCWDMNQVPNLLLHPHPGVCRQGEGSRKEPTGLCLHPLSEHWAELQSQIHAGSLIKSDTHLYPASFKDFSCTPPLHRSGSAPSAPARLITKQWSGKLEELSVRWDYSNLGWISTKRVLRNDELFPRSLL